MFYLPPVAQKLLCFHTSSTLPPPTSAQWLNPTLAAPLPFFAGDVEDMGFKVPNTSLTSQAWACSGVSLRPTTLGDSSVSSDEGQPDCAEALAGSLLVVVGGWMGGWGSCCIACSECLREGNSCTLLVARDPLGTHLCQVFLVCAC